MGATTQGRGLVDLAGLRARADVTAALEHIVRSDAETLADMVAAAGIPAPTGQERARGDWLCGRFAALGMGDAGRDVAGNIIARWPAAQENGSADTPAIVLAAHLDTVFPAGTDVRVQVQNGVLHGPGIADNARGLAALLAVCRALRSADWSPRRPVVFVGTVGEEGAGNLRGVRHLLREGAALRRAAAFIAVDGTGRRQIVNRGVGSIRLRFEVSGPGGHSWSERGASNPLHALAGAVVAIGRATPPGAHITATRMAGGESVNSIPAAAWLELDIRSCHADALEAAERAARSAVERAVARAQRRARPGARELCCDVWRIGDRPTGVTPPASPLVRIAAAATRALGEEPELTAASTDANVPLALGIPAIALGAGGRSGATHTTAEWYDNDGGPEGLQRLLLTVVALSELDPP